MDSVVCKVVALQMVSEQDESLIDKDGGFWKKLQDYEDPVYAYKHYLQRL